MRIAAFLGWVFITLSCQTSRPSHSEGTSFTDETRKSVLALCRDISPEGDRAQRLEQACACLHTKKDLAQLAPLIERFCKEGAAYYDALLRSVDAEALLLMTSTSGAVPSASDLQCAHGLAEAKVEWAIDAVSRACQSGKDSELLSLLDLPSPAAAEACWRMISMDDKNCIVAAPCTGRGSAHIDGLPINAQQLATWVGQRVFQEGQTIKLCHPVIQDMHRLKDPHHANIQYNYPFANFIAMNRSNAPVTYGAANCHGTAQALSNEFLSRLPVETTSFHSPDAQAKCGALAEAAFVEATTNAMAQGYSQAVGGLLPIKKGGYVVNMNHNVSCAAEDCGRGVFQTFSCSENQLESYVFIDGMCINCWHRLLEEAGKKRLGAEASWRDLRRGCVLTTEDHSVTHVYENDGFCYFYETLSPFAAPQLNVLDCPGLFARFPNRWCPNEGAQLAFDAVL